MVQNMLQRTGKPVFFKFRRDTASKYFPNYTIEQHRIIHECRYNNWIDEPVKPACRKSKSWSYFGTVLKKFTCKKKVKFSDLIEVKTYKRRAA